MGFPFLHDNRFIIIAGTKSQISIGPAFTSVCPVGRSSDLQIRPTSSAQLVGKAAGCTVETDRPTAGPLALSNLTVSVKRRYYHCQRIQGPGITQLKP